MTVNAQNNLGVRLGGGQGFGTELSWQHDLGSNRLELDLGWHDGDYWNDINLVGIYQWRGSISGNFGWYAGVGAGLTIVTWDNGHDGDGDFALGVAGQAGLEYKFNAVPLQLSLDIRPRLNIINPYSDGMDFHWGDIALGIRFCF
ncbi:MAG: outer membrane beta-barrel protein [Bacteroidaceae bacterium]|nr:outer membrane beta-barrel protein [Bacteroidaceae bacterium]